MSSSPSYSALLRQLKAKVDNLQPLSPTASPGTVAQRRADYRLGQQIFSTIETIMKEGEDDDEEEDTDTNSTGGNKDGDAEPDVDPIAKRAENVMPEAGTLDDFLEAPDFLLLLLNGRSSQHKASEDAGFRSLFSGYADTQAEWTKALEPLLVARLDWESVCDRSVQNDSKADMCERLLETHKDLALKPSLDRGVFFVDYVLRQVEVLKFAILWDENDDQKRWKMDYMEAAFRADFAELYGKWERARSRSQLKADLEQEIHKEEKRWKKDFGRVVKQRRTLLMLYRKFGPGIFLDEICETVGPRGPSKPVKRSVQFVKVAEYICANLPNMPHPNEELPLPMSTHVWNADSLYRILQILSGSDVVPVHVQNFLRAHPPDDCDEEWKWGLNEYGQNDTD
ncbi:hypothetical protein DFH06DRAFT_1225232 [Mycena polygramma]|nr:hypothetical protein DFH06DRAFT_1225232 [Mycena polygramma]